MKKILYIIPAWMDTCELKPYQCLAQVAEEKGYEVICKDVDWGRPLSPQIFEIHESAVIFGFSLGAIMAWLVAQKYECEHLILASMTLHSSFTDNEDKRALIELAGSEFVEDIINNIQPTHRAKRQTVIYGDREGEIADILVRDTEHELSANYIDEISKIL